MTTQLRRYFLPDPKIVKKCVESLIEREYLDRDEDDISVVIYVA